MQNVNEVCDKDGVETFFRNKITLLGNHSINPYTHAKIEVLSLDPSRVLPSAKYVLNENLDRLELTYRKYLNKGVDIYNLCGITNLGNDVFMCPPVLELWERPPYNNTPTIVDGGHRLFLALKLGLSVTCILISGCIGAPLPVLPLNWGEVAVCNSVPKDKRNYNPDLPDGLPPEHFYRVPIPGSSGPRVSSENKIY